LHLKDVTGPGAHKTCRLGAGVVHEPEEYNPNDDCVASLALVRRALA
jgi:hypothetical protein